MVNTKQIKNALTAAGVSEFTIKNQGTYWTLTVFGDEDKMLDAVNSLNLAPHFQSYRCEYILEERA
jgi:hypothetical protein